MTDRKLKSAQSRSLAALQRANDRRLSQREFRRAYRASKRASHKASALFMRRKGVAYGNPGLPVPALVAGAAVLGWWLLRGKPSIPAAGASPTTGQPSGARPQLNPCAISGAAMTGTLQWRSNGGPSTTRQGAGYAGPTGGWQCVPN